MKKPTVTPQDPKIESVRVGQQLVLLAAFLIVITPFITKYVPGVGGFVGGLTALIGLIMAIVGLVRVSKGIETAVFFKVLTLLCMFVPFVNLIALLVVNFYATKFLRAAGYTVGLTGSHK